MYRVSLEVAEREFILARIGRFESEVAPALRWQSTYVRSHEALPLYVGWTETLGIRADGSLVRWSTENEWPGVREYENAIWVNIALVRGAADYPQLRRLIPKRPPDATTCDACQGAGIIPDLPAHLKDLVCKCGGIGWLPSDAPVGG